MLWCPLNPGLNSSISEGAFSCPLVLSGWVAAKSVRLYVDKKYRYHFLAVMGHEPPVNQSLETVRGEPGMEEGEEEGGTVRGEPGMEEGEEEGETVRGEPGMEEGEEGETVRGEPGMEEGEEGETVRGEPGREQETVQEIARKAEEENMEDLGRVLEKEAMDGNVRTAEEELELVRGEAPGDGEDSNMEEGEKP